jgi:hypothetical protein
LSVSFPKIERQVSGRSLDRSGSKPIRFAAGNGCNLADCGLPASKADIQQSSLGHVAPRTREMALTLSKKSGLRQDRPLLRALNH